MPKFKYVAMDARGRETRGEIEAETQARAIDLLKERNYYPTNVTLSTGRRGGGAAAKGGKKEGKGGLSTEITLPGFLNRVKPKELMVFTRQLATLQNAGLPLLRSLNVLQRQQQNVKLRNAIGGMADSVESGSTFAEALAQQDDIFDRFFVNMVRAGEASGSLDTILVRLADFLEKAERTKNKVKGAMVYPMVVMFMAMAILIVLMVFVVPQFEEIFADLLGDQPLPALTQFVLAASTAILENGLIILGIIVVIVVGSKFFKKTKVGAQSLDRFKLRAPIFGPLFLKTAVSNFSRTLGTLMTGGVPVLQALNIVREVVNSDVIAQAVSKVHDSVKEGESMVTPMENSRIFPSMVISMIQVGEETGALPDMMMKVADTYDNEVDTAVEAMTSVIEPILIIFLAVIVGTIVIAMFMPLVSIIDQLA